MQSVRNELKGEIGIRYMIKIPRAALQLHRLAFKIFRFYCHSSYKSTNHEWHAEKNGFSFMNGLVTNPLAQFINLSKREQSFFFILVFVVFLSFVIIFNLLIAICRLLGLLNGLRQNLLHTKKTNYTQFYAF